MTKDLCVFGKKDTLRLKSAGVLVRKLWIHPDCTFGVVCYRSTTGVDDFEKQFTISHGGAGLNLLPSPAMTSLVQLPNAVLKRIFTHLFSTSHLGYDLITKNRITWIHSLLVVSRVIRNE
jgi:hypothetical protein